MREFNFRIDKPFKLGISKEGYATSDVQSGFILAYNAFLNSQGIRNISGSQIPRVLIADATLTAAGCTHAYPYPRIECIGTHSSQSSTAIDQVFAFDKSKLFALTIGSNPPTDTAIAQLNTYKIDRPVQTVEWDDSELPWNVAVIGGGNFFAFNGKSVVLRHNLSKVSQDYSETDAKIFVYNYTGATNHNTITTGCYFEGRLVLGGFMDTALASYEYYQELEHIQEQMVSDGLLDVDVGMGGETKRNYIWWSSIGGGDMLYPFYPDLLYSGTSPRTENDNNEDNPRWAELIDRNQGGFMPMPFINCAIQDILPFGDGVMVYTDKGICYCPMVNKGEISTFGCKVVSNVGLMSKGCVAGGLGKHIFIDHEGKICMLAKGKTKTGASVSGLPSITVLYDRVQKSATAKPSVTYDSDAERYHISNLGNSYADSWIYNDPYGLTQVGTQVTSIVNLGYADAVTPTISDRTSFWQIDSGVDDLILGTQLFSFDMSGIKLIKGIYINADFGGKDLYNDTSKAYIKLLGRQPGGSATSILGTFPINKEGFCYINKSADTFQILLGIVDDISAEEITIKSLDVKWSLLDKRFTRGFYPQQGGQAKK